MRVTFTSPDAFSKGPVAVQFSVLDTVTLHVLVTSTLPLNTLIADVLFFVVSAANCVSDTFVMPSVMTDGVAVTV